MKLFFYGLFVLSIGLQSLAAELCKQTEGELTKKFLGLIYEIKDAKRTVKSVDEFLSLLPVELRKDIIFMSDSRSLQKSSALSPRVILKSPDSEIVLSFSTLKGSEAYENVEVLVWDGPKAEFSLFDLNFKKIDKNGNPLVSKNPKQCLKCHQDNVRPIWDTYNFWAGMVPFNRDNLYAGTQEATWYLNYMSRVEAGEERWRHLAPRIKPSDLRDRLAKESSVHIPTEESDGPGVDLFDELSNKNNCKNGHEVPKNPYWEKAKYAIYVVKNCTSSDVPKALSPEMIQKTEAYFANRGIFSRGDVSTYQALLDNTRSRQLFQYNDKYTRQLEFLTREMKSETAALAEMAKAGEASNRESSEYMVVPLRFILEPMGVQMSRWSMSIDPLTYSFADLFNLQSLDPYFKGINDDYAAYSKSEQNNTNKLSICAWATKKSIETYNLDQAESQELSKRINVKPQFFKVEDRPVNSSIDQLRVNAVKVLEDNDCASCHADGSEGSPLISFDDILGLENRLRTHETANYRRSFKNVILNRVSRDEREPGHMPKGGGSLNVEEIQVLRDYFSRITP